MQNGQVTDRRKGVTQFTVHIPEAEIRRGTPAPPTTKPRWSTLEFRLYAVAFAIVVPLMVWVPLKLGDSKQTANVYPGTIANHPPSESHPNYPNYAYRLSDGWIPGRKVVSRHRCYQIVQLKSFSHRTYPTHNTEPSARTFPPLSASPQPTSSPPASSRLFAHNYSLNQQRPTSSSSSRSACFSSCTASEHSKSGSSSFSIGH
jgi:hypothetical protein